MNESKNAKTKEQTGNTDATASKNAPLEGGTKRAGSTGQSEDPGKGAFSTPLGAAKAEDRAAE